MAEHNYNCKYSFPGCLCLTCKKDDGEEGICCIDHHKICSGSWKDYEKEEDESDG